jgi:hypothetical protein
LALLVHNRRLPPDFDSPPSAAMPPELGTWYGIRSRCTRLLVILAVTMVPAAGGFRTLLANEDA